MTDDTRDQPGPDPSFIDLTPGDLPRIKDLEDMVWFDVQPGGTPADLEDDLDFTYARAVLRAGGPLPGEPEDGAVPLAGMYSAYPMTLTLPGPDDGPPAVVPMSGLTWVGVHTDSRRQGLLTRMIRDHLHRVRADGEAAVSGLQASEPGIYGRFGYGHASTDVKLELGRGTTFRAPVDIDEAAGAVQTHVVTLPTPEGMAALHEAHLACAATTVGTVTRPADKAQVWFRDLPTSRGRKEPRRLMLARRDGTITGYAVFRREPRWEDGTPKGTVDVPEMGAADRPSLLALARRLVNLDLTSRVDLWGRAPDDPLLWWAGGPRSASPKTIDSLWVRLVDLPRALTERGYAAACDLVLEVTDELCDWNAGRWRLTVDAVGRATCTRTEAEADLVVPVAALGAAYLGGRSVASLAPVLGLTEHRPGAVRALSRAMRGDIDPVGAIGF